MNNLHSNTESIVPFFALTFLLSVPFYILNALAYQSIVGKPEMGSVYIALFTVTPLLSASILTYQSRGVLGFKTLLGRILDFRRVEKKRWYFAILLLSPLIYLFALGVLSLSGTTVPPASLPLEALPVLIVFFFILAAGEEVGWMGYAFDPMQSRRGSLKAATMLGIIWALWHLPFFIFMMPDLLVLSTQLLSLAATRVLIAWIYNNTGKSVFASILFHAVSNVALVAFPDIKSVTPLGTLALCSTYIIAAIVIILFSDKRTLVRA